MARLAASLVALALLAAPADAATQKHFKTPSKRIACLMTSDFVRCDTFFLNDTAFFLSPNGKGRRNHATDTVSLPHERILAYGKSLSLGSFTCTSRSIGLTCENRKGHGFFVSVQSQRVY